MLRIFFVVSLKCFSSSRKCDLTNSMCPRTLSCILFIIGAIVFRICNSPVFSVFRIFLFSCMKSFARLASNRSSFTCLRPSIHLALFMHAYTNQSIHSFLFQPNRLISRPMPKIYPNACPISQSCFCSASLSVAN